jgi:protein O-GlcNAc transferase
LAINPNYADAYNNLGNVFQDLQQPDNAIECYRQSIRVQPNSVFAYRNLGYVLKEQGLINDGLKLLEQAQRIEPNDVIRYVIATSLPPVYDSLEDLNNRRAKLEANVDQMIADGLKIDVTTSSAPTMFYAAYQGLNDRDLQRKLASLLSAPQPLLAKSNRSSGSRVRIGFISRHYRNHTIGRLNLGTVRELPRDKFEVTVISVGHHDDMLSHDFQKAADHYVSLPTNLQEIRRRVAELELDILFFSDVGMDTLTYSLCMSRMAPVQCATWGHPETTGSSVMDYFVSSKTLEVGTAQDHYSERLARLDVLNVFYYRPEPPQKKDHSHFGLDPGRHIYLCFQNLFKIHPDFDEVLAGILQRDPQGDIVMMEGRHVTWTKMLQSRLERNLGSNAARVKFLPSQSHPDFMSLNALADVSLDPMHFGGGNTTYEALAIGLPVVTLPSDFLRARITLAMYSQMGFLDCVVSSPSQYIDLAVRLGTDRTYRQSIHENILATCPVLFEDRRAIQQYSEFFQSIAPV